VHFCISIQLPDVRYSEKGEIMKWSYGVMATPCRTRSVLPETLVSLVDGGFEKPQVFMDVDGFGAFGNFVLGMWRLYLTDCNADLYAMFQDDLVCYRNLRQYLERCEYPERGYWNLLTWSCNVKDKIGWSLSDQWGRGAVALVFSNEALRVLLSSRFFVDHRRNAHVGHKAIDKAVIMSFKQAEGIWEEWVHMPSLVQHTGLQSTIGNDTRMQSPVFNGKDFDAMALLNL
jgi:hypothetical protein